MKRMAKVVVFAMVMTMLAAFTAGAAAKNAAKCKDHCCKQSSKMCGFLHKAFKVKYCDTTAPGANK